MATLQAMQALAIVLISLTGLTLVQSESCLDRTYNRAESGPILSETTLPPLPSGCDSPSGLTCDWYPDCLNRCFYNCDQQSIDSAQTYCSKFSTNLWYFTQTGIRWVFSVRKCQQSMLVGQLAMDPIPSCDKISEKVQQSHIDCFADPNPQSNNGDSICGLQCQDFLAIFKTVEDETKMKFEETLMSAFREAEGQCASQGAAANFHQCFNQNSGGYFRLVRFVLAVAEEKYNTVRDRRSAECDDKCISENVTNYLLNEKLGYAKNSTLDWSNLVKRLPSANIEISIIFMDSSFLTNANSSLDNVDMIASKTADLLETDPNVKVDDTQYEVLEVSSCGDFLCSPGNSIIVRLGPETTSVTSTSPTTTSSSKGTAMRSTADSTQSSTAVTEDSTTAQADDGSASGDDDGVISDKSVYDPENGATHAVKWNVEFMFSVLITAQILKLMFS